MSSPFLISNGGTSLAALQDGSTGIFVSSCKVANLGTNLPVKTDLSKNLVTGQITLSDCNFVPITNPYTGTLTATVDVLAGTNSLNTAYSNSVTALATASNCLLKSGGTMTGNISMGGLNITNCGTIGSAGSMTISASGVGVINLNTSGTQILTNCTLNMVGNSIAAVAVVSGDALYGGLSLYGGVAQSITMQSSIASFYNGTLNIGSVGNPFAAIYCNTITLNGTDLNTRISAIETKTQYQSAAASVTTFTGTVAVGTLNNVSGVALQYNGATALVTTATGITVTSAVSCGTVSSASSLSITSVTTMSLTATTAMTINAVTGITIQFNGSTKITVATGGCTLAGTTVAGVINFSTGPVLQFNAATKLAITTTGATVTGVLVPDADNTRTLGASATRFTIIYASTIDSSAGVQLNYNAAARLTTNSAGITIAGTTIPNADITLNLGSASNRWNYIYTSSIDSSTGVSLAYNSSTKASTTSTGLQVFGNVYPSSDNANSLGLSSSRYATCYTTSIDSNTGWSMLANTITQASITIAGLNMSNSINCASNNINLPVLPDKALGLMNIQGSTMALTAGVTAVLTPSGGTVTSINALNGITNTIATFLSQYTGARTLIMNVVIQLSVSTNTITTLTIFSSLNATTTPPATGAKSQIQMTATGTVYNITLIDQVSAAQNSTFRVGMTSSATATITLVYASMRIVGELN